jgi:hypothetical protein
MDQDADRQLTPAHETPAHETPAHETNVIGLAIGLVLGVPLMLIGVVGILRHTAATPPSSYLRFFVGGDLVHDLVVAPIAALVAIVVLRRTPAIARGPLRAALFGSAVMVAIAWPGIRHYGRMRAPDNVSVQPLNYATSTATAVAVVWAIAALWLAIAIVRTRGKAAAAPQPILRRDS